MKQLSLVLLFVSFSSCEYFDKKKIYTEDIVEEELKTFNWNEVDEYPTFDSCENESNKLARKNCFQNTLVIHITDYLKEQLLVVTEDVNDTITMRLGVSEIGDLSVLEITNSQMLSNHIPEIDSLLKTSLHKLPKIHPAIKRGQQVKTEFKLPIVVRVN